MIYNLLGMCKLRCFQQFISFLPKGETLNYKMVARDDF